MTTQTTQVYHLDDGGWLVRGTDDVDLATPLLLADQDFEELECWQLADEGYDVEPVMEQVRAGLFRFNPCHHSMCSDGHAWHLGFESKPGRGVFRGVLVGAVGWEPVEYGVDE